MDITGIEEILGRNDEEFNAFTTAGRSGKFSPEDGQRLADYFRSLVEESRKESLLHPDPEAAFRKIVEAKLVESSKEVVQRAAQKLAKTQGASQLKTPAQARK